MEGVVGRDAELAAGAAFLARAAHGPAAMLIEGEAGIGKTTVWQALVRQARADGRRVLTTRPTASDASLTLAALGDLLDGLDAELLDELPAPQRRALAGARLRADGDAPDPEPRLVGAAVRTALATAAARGPLILAIEDLQWVDPASATVLAYVLRRMPEAPIGILASRRAGEPTALDLAGLPSPDMLTSLVVKPLSVGALHYVLAGNLGRPLPRSLLVRIHTASGGVPLFAIEIAKMLQEDGVPPIGTPLPVPRDVRDLVRRRVSRLPARSREVLLAAAVEGHADLESLAAALGRPIERDLAIASRLEVAHVEANHVVFAHPLFAAAVLAVGSDADRRLAHQRMAAVAVTAEGRARHRALASPGASAEVAAELERAAREAASRGSPSSAADLLDLAIGATPADDTAGREQRSWELAELVKRAGDPGRARGLLEALIASTSTTRLRARARVLLATILYETDAAGSQLELCEEAIVDAGDDAEVAAHAHAVAAAISWDDFRRRDGHVEAAIRLLDGVPDPDPVVAASVLMARCESDVAAGRPLDPATVRRGLELEERVPTPSVSDRFSAALGAWLKYQDDFEGARTWLGRTLQAAIDEGDEGSMAYALSHLPELELWSGSWDAAEAFARRHLAVAAGSGLEAQRRQAVYNLALVLAHRGDQAAVRDLVAETLPRTIADGDTWSEASLLAALGHLELSLGRAAQAAAVLARAGALRDAAGHASPRRFDADLVESVLLVGDLPAARRAAEAMLSRALPSGRRSAMALAHRARAIVAASTGDLDVALAAMADALAEHDRAPIPVDRARTMLALGQLRRRRRERALAREALDEARAVFDRLGARAWAERARDDLERLGTRRAADDGLTDGERQVVELAARGLKNREVAAALFISPKTVEANLARAYAKLGVRSRAELGARYGRGEADAD